MENTIPLPLPEVINLTEQFSTETVWTNWNSGRSNRKTKHLKSKTYLNVEKKPLLFRDWLDMQSKCALP